MNSMTYRDLPGTALIDSAVSALRTSGFSVRRSQASSASGGRVACAAARDRKRLSHHRILHETRGNQPLGQG